MAFESKVDTRSRAVVMFGEPIDVAEFAGSGLGDDGEPDPADAAALTARITQALEQVSPQFASIEEREMLRAAGREERSLATGRLEVSFADAEIVARRLARTEPATRNRIMSAYREFATRLQLLGITARQLHPRRVSIGRLALSAALLIVAGSMLVTVTLIHLPALLIVVVGTGLVRSTATKGTVRMLLGLGSLLVTWTVTGAWLADGWAAVATALAVAAGAVVALIVWPPIYRQATVLIGWLKTRNRVGLLPPVLEARSSLVAAVRESLGASDDDRR
jgi:hypothetical protein